MVEVLEQEMEEVVARCPELFIESGLQFVRRQVVLNGRRPDILFHDVLNRHLLVELQRGRLDEEHLQRHVFYFYDYRAKYPDTHPRLMFLANRVIPQHKEFLDYHGYEYKEIPEREFSRRMAGCTNSSVDIEIETNDSPGVLPLSYQELLYSVETQPMTMCYKMLLLLEMIDGADSNGRVPVDTIALKFKSFFQSRLAIGKTEENPRRFHRGRLSDRSLDAWKTVIREQPVAHLGPKFIIDEHKHLRWAPQIWSQWNADLKRELRDAAMRRLVTYFDKYVPGGF
jgi:endonuclease NucS-like protein